MSDSVSEISVTSTILYDQEPFETFQHKAVALLLGRWPHCKESDITVERLNGGTYNRIIGIEVGQPHSRASCFLSLWSCAVRHLTGADSSEPVNSQRLVLRIPREGERYRIDMDYHVATLFFVGLRLPLPTPRIVSYDKSENNPLGRAYMLQGRLPGRPLHQVWNDMNTNQKKSLAREVTKVLFEMQNITSEYSGIISKSSTALELAGGTLRLETIAVPPLGQTDPLFTKPNTSPSAKQTTAELLLSLCTRWKDYDRARNVHSRDHIWNGFAVMTKTFYDLNYLPDDEEFHLCHLDFQMRNILVEIFDDSNVKITGILDWDSAVFAPRFFSYRPPYFLWDNDHSEENDEALAWMKPSNEEGMILKGVYEKTAGEEVLQFAYTTSYVFLRQLFHFLYRGINTAWERQTALYLLRDFENAYLSDQ